jgi:hypothetical protein
LQHTTTLAVQPNCIEARIDGAISDPGVLFTSLHESFIDGDIDREQFQTLRDRLLEHWIAERLDKDPIFLWLGEELGKWRNEAFQSHVQYLRDRRTEQISLEVGEWLGPIIAQVML